MERPFVAATLFFACAAWTAGALAHGDEEAFGREGDARHVTRTVRVEMSDEMRFEPSSIAVRKGETIRFVIHNGGAVPHEMVLGTRADLVKHAEMMKKFPGMVHEEPSMARVEPGRRGEIVWQFSKRGRFEFACLVPGHFDAGMVGSLDVR
jgi:uncharacterized cupredoxin-like copper-binding protein